MADDPAELVRRHPTLLPKFRAVRFVAGAPSRAAPQLPAALTRAALQVERKMREGIEKAQVRQQRIRGIHVSQPTPRPRPPQPAAAAAGVDAVVAAALPTHHHSGCGVCGGGAAAAAAAARRQRHRLAAPRPCQRRTTHTTSCSAALPQQNKATISPNKSQSRFNSDGYFSEPVSAPPPPSIDRRLQILPSLLLSPPIPCPGPPGAGGAAT